MFSALLRSIVRWFGSSDVRAPQNLIVLCPCEPEALPIIAEQLRAFGARVTFDRQWAGLVMSESGTLFFRYNNHVLTVSVVEDLGHFTRALMIGGVKQTVEEANEIVRRARAQNSNPSVSAEESANA